MRLNLRISQKGEGISLQMIHLDSKAFLALKINKIFDNIIQRLSTVSTYDRRSVKTEHPVCEQVKYVTRTVWPFVNMNSEHCTS